MPTSKKGNSLDIHKLIGLLPRPKRGFTLPNHKFTGPFNPLEKQLDAHDNPLPGQEPYNQVDRVSLFHDICYRDNDTKEGKSECDKKMLVSLREIVPKGMREKFDRAFVSSIIGAKHKLGLGIKGKWSDELANELHRPVRRKFKRRRVIAHGIDDIWACDLVEMKSFSKQNKGYKYILTIIDIFSKYGFMVPLKDKTGSSVAKAFQEVFKESGRKPNKIWTDKGKEFYNKNVRSVLGDIELYSTENEEKSSVVERWNRTMREKLFKYFSANNTSIYYNILPELVRQYNSTKHSSINMTPTSASRKQNEPVVYKNLYGSKRESAGKAKFNLGDYVRIPKKKTCF